MAGGVDLQILGIGTDGHIAFNEPGSSLASQNQNQDPDAPDPPRQRPLLRWGRRSGAHPLSDPGLATIMAARHVVLLASGRSKAEAVHHLVEGSVSAMWPATILQHHPHVTVLLDGAAAQRLQLADYYRENLRIQARLAGPVGCC